MSASQTGIGPLNPDVYLNHLAPAQAEQVEISRNIIVVVLGSIIWDILVYVLDDVRIVRRSQFHFVIFCFVFTRLSAAGYVFLNGIERVTPLSSLEGTIISSGILCMLSMNTSSYLFLQRVQAVYADTKWVRRLFFILWVILLGTEVLIPIGIKPASIPGTRYYLDAGVPPYVALSIFTLLFYDTSVFIAISYKISSGYTSIPRNEGVPWYSLISGRTLPRLSRAVFRGGQQYYLITVGMTIFIGITTSLPSVPQIFKTTFPTTMVPLMASMACRVFRNTKQFDLNAYTETRTPNTPDV